MRQRDSMGTVNEAAMDDSHLGIALLVGTLVASPVLLAALSGRQAVPTALALYVAAIIGSWMVVGLVAGAFAMVADGQGRGGAGADGDDEDGAPAGDDTIRPTRETDPAAPSR